ncbi:8-hydroxy-dADP phosphatase activity protein [Homalodisca vitripennis]|nr:8-hydroxy-dADP phosphatase activity protein [Homalodisca vitripennis]
MNLPASHQESQQWNYNCEAVKREVLEETGLTMEPTSLIMVECASKAWFRFVLTGRITGGILKTPAQADSESLQVF